MWGTRNQPIGRRDKKCGEPGISQWEEGTKSVRNQESANRKKGIWMRAWLKGQEHDIKAGLKKKVVLLDRSWAGDTAI